MRKNANMKIQFISICSQIPVLVEHLRTKELESEKTEDDLPYTTDTIVGTIFTYASNFRIGHLTRQQVPALVCAGMVSHPGNFIRYADEVLNDTDVYYRSFFKEYKDLDEDLKWSLKNVVVSEGRK